MMLVLSRRKGESIRVGDDIVITIFEFGRDQVRIGISAPLSTTVHREEVYEEILQANIAAANDTIRVIEVSRAQAQQALDQLPARPTAGRTVNSPIVDPPIVDPPIVDSPIVDSPVIHSQG